EQLDVLPEATRPLMRHLINQRLLVTKRSVIDGVETDTVEVTHEAILRQWPALRTWIVEEREALHVLDDVRTAARDWSTQARQDDKGQSWLVHSGGRLDETERLLSPQHFSSALRTVEREYLALCRSRENAVRERERIEIAREKRAIAHTKRLQRRIFVLIGVAIVIVLLAGFGITNLLTG